MAVFVLVATNIFFFVFAKQPLGFFFGFSNCEKALLKD